MRTLDKVAFAQRLLHWYDDAARDLPWRHNVTPYRIWVSEIMLQQTRVETVIPYYERFLATLPTIEDLAKADDEVLAKLWEGLGYYRRARHMKEAAKQVMERHGGKFPSRKEDIEALKGIGEYTSGAIRSIAFEQPAAAVDGNVLRVFARLLFEEGDIADNDVKRRLKEAVEDRLPNHRNGDFTQALMELGATVCLPNGVPKCGICPFADVCAARLENGLDRIPKKAKKTSRRSERHTVILLQDEKGLVHLNKRPEKGLLASLWEFDGGIGHMDETTVNFKLDSMGYRVNALRRLEDRTHVFSHLEWDMIGYFAMIEHAMEPQSGIWVTPQEIALSYSIPTAIRPYFEQAVVMQGHL